MGKLRDLLTAEGERYRSEKAKRQQALSEWLKVLTDLYSQFDSWLASSDPDGLLDITRKMAPVNDPALGPYNAQTLWVALGDKSVEIGPRAVRRGHRADPRPRKADPRAGTGRNLRSGVPQLLLVPPPGRAVVHSARFA